MMLEWCKIAKRPRALASGSKTLASISWSIVLLLPLLHGSVRAQHISSRNHGLSVLATANTIRTSAAL